MKFVKSLLVAATVSSIAVTSSLANDALVKEGEKIFTSKGLGNCVACHAVNGSDKVEKMGPGSMGPKLTGLSYWDDKTLYDTIYNIYEARGLKSTSMPAFGVNGHLGDSEIKALVAYLKTIN